MSSMCKLMSSREPNNEYKILHKLLQGTGEHTLPEVIEIFRVFTDVCINAAPVCDYRRHEDRTLQERSSDNEEQQPSHTIVLALLDSVYKAFSHDDFAYWAYKNGSHEQVLEKVFVIMRKCTTTNCDIGQLRRELATELDIYRRRFKKHRFLNRIISFLICAMMVVALIFALCKYLTISPCDMIPTALNYMPNLYPKAQRLAYSITENWMIKTCRDMTEKLSNMLPVHNPRHIRLSNNSSARSVTLPVVSDEYTRRFQMFGKIDKMPLLRAKNSKGKFLQEAIKVGDLSSGNKEKVLSTLSNPEIVLTSVQGEDESTVNAIKTQMKVSAIVLIGNIAALMFNTVKRYLQRKERAVLKRKITDASLNKFTSNLPMKKWGNMKMHVVEQLTSNWLRLQYGQDDIVVTKYSQRSGESNVKRQSRWRWGIATFLVKPEQEGNVYNLVSVRIPGEYLKSDAYIRRIVASMSRTTSQTLKTTNKNKLINTERSNQGDEDEEGNISENRQKETIRWQVDKYQKNSQIQSSPFNNTTTDLHVVTLNISAVEQQDNHIKDLTVSKDFPYEMVKDDLIKALSSKLLTLFNRQLIRQNRKRKIKVSPTSQNTTADNKRDQRRTKNPKMKSLE